MRKKKEHYMSTEKRHYWIILMIWTMQREKKGREKGEREENC